MDASRVKIVATLGPASGSPQTLEALIAAGVDVVRLNMSHGTRAQHIQLLAASRGVAADLGKNVAVMADLCGPKIRIGRLKGGGPIQLEAGARLAIVATDVEGTADEISTNNPAILAELRPDASVLIDDGRITLRVVEAEPGRVITEVIDGGSLSERKGLSSPGIGAHIASLTEKDREDLRWAVEAGVDIVALSFVRKAHDIRITKALIGSFGADTPVLAKIEKQEAVDDLDAILEACDGVMVARGDLALETSIESVPVFQKEIIRRANAAGKPVITATEMLQSMTDNPRPTRAEAADVANAVLDGTDAVMLSAETSVGRYPVEAVTIMDRIIRRTEAIARPRELRRRSDRHAAPGLEGDAMAVAAAGVVAAAEVGASVIGVISASGAMVRAVAALRPPSAIFAFTASETVARRLALVWGVTAIALGSVESLAECRWRAVDRMETDAGVRSGDRVVIISGKGLEETVAARMEVVVAV